MTRRMTRRRNPATEKDLEQTLLVAGDAAEEIGRHDIAAILRVLASRGDSIDTTRRLLKAFTRRALDRASFMLIQIDDEIRRAARSATDPRDDHEMPAGLSPRGEHAWKVIVDWLRAHDLTYTGGCKMFYSPAEWRDRGEQYCREADLIVVYDGGDMAQVMDAADGGRAYESLHDALAQIGVYTEAGTNWYSGVYPIGVE